ncbi:DUF262 domain-containing protein [Rathayibacter sp. VKM Ac-2857]|uniref:DUF262 domain-containing protein n=1 Tax=Rathayibacter sp. VKM Ac-2857 TaxID=2739020 RepID=UPI001566748C|nr:DUF262 domain-containing protein [Rathayibacter sp. VKM Ac-2857]NQX16435.1 DUF262 domain-containing protein [Rathayibacter sp. VKM Ac-2857]
MTDAITEKSLNDEENMSQLQERIAELLSELSDAADSPKGVSATSRFAPEDVRFDSDSWMARLIEVQGWLRLAEDLPTTGPHDLLSSLAASLGFEDESEAIEYHGTTPSLSNTALERLSARSELAARLQQVFFANLDADGGTRTSATTYWDEAWVAREDDEETIDSEPVTAKADVWHIFTLTKKKLNLTPSYQRGDVWRISDRQALIESILRGIPLPSIILLRTGGTAPNDVVDGKQRLTSILRFVGLHPRALEKVGQLDRDFPDAGFASLFHNDYPKFRAAWKNAMIYPLTAKLEDDFYFPFKLRSDANGGLVGTDLEPLRGKYFTQIKDSTIKVADQEVTVDDLFGGAPDYKVPVIEYTKATQRQIHEVFKLYNKQGMHLNAEEIRNAVYHDIELTRAILVAAGDASSQSKIADVAPSLMNVPNIEDLGTTLSEYGFGEARYRRTKVLGWIVATLVCDSNGKLLPSTSRHTDQLLSQVQEKPDHPLRSSVRIADLFGLISQAADLHASYGELWPDAFKGDGKSSKWQDLQLVGSLVGIAVALAGSPDDIEARIVQHAKAIREAAPTEWKRPEKTQTRSQWQYIAKLVEGINETLGVDLTTASNSMRARFGSSGIESLLGSAQKIAK